MHLFSKRVRRKGSCEEEDEVHKSNGWGRESNRWATTFLEEVGKEMEKGFNAIPSKVTSMELCKWSKSIGHWLGSLTSNVTPILKEWNLFNNLINYFNNFDIITTQWWMHSKKPINLVLGILYLNYTLEVFFIFYKLILWNTTRLCILIIKHLKGVNMY